MLTCRNCISQQLENSCFTKHAMGRQLCFTRFQHPDKKMLPKLPVWIVR